MALSNQGQVRDWCLRSVLERKDDTSVVSARIVLRVSRRSFLANVSVVVLSVEIMSEQVVALEHFALEEREVEQALARVNVRAVDYADIYFESTISESVSMEEGIVKRAVKSISQGAGVRATSGEKTGFAYSDELSTTGFGNRRGYCTVYRRLPARRRSGPRHASSRRDAQSLSS